MGPHTTDIPAPAAAPPTPLAARVLPATTFYGWYVALGCAVLMLVGVGVGYYGLALFLRPLQEDHGWSNAAVSGATGLYFSVSGLTGALVGPVVDRRGPLQLMWWGIILLGAAVAMVGFVESLWQLYAAYALLAVAFGLSTSVGVNSIMARWFVAKRAKAMSIAFTGISVGGVLLAPIGTALIDVGGLELATPVLGALVVAVALPIIAFVLVWDPAEMGLGPDGGAPIPTSSRAALDDAVQRRSWTRAQAVRTLTFWAILVAFVLVLTAQTGFVIHQVSFLEDRLGSRSAAALTLSTTALGSIIARLVVGQVADRLDKRLLTVVLFAVQGSAVLALVAVDSRVATYALVLVFGFTIGNVYMMQSLLVGEVFGIVSFGTVFGLVSLAGQVGSGLGPFFVGWLEGVSGSYGVPFAVTALVTWLAGVVVLLVRPVAPPAEVPPVPAVVPAP